MQHPTLPIAFLPQMEREYLLLDLQRILTIILSNRMKNIQCHRRPVQGGHRMRNSARNAPLVAGTEIANDAADRETQTAGK